MAGLMCAGALLLGVTLAGARYSNSSKDASASTAETTTNAAMKTADENSVKIAKIHEGDELVEQTGRFSTSGDRVVFIAAKSQQQYIVLENLMLQRVTNPIDGDSTPQPWIISGNVTEYCNVIYLLLTDARRDSERSARDSKL